MDILKEHLSGFRFPPPGERIAPHRPKRTGIMAEVLFPARMAVAHFRGSRFRVQKAMRRFIGER